MAEERRTEVETPEGRTHTHTTVVTDEPRGRSSSGWIIALVLILALLVGIYLFTQTSGAEVAKDNAIAEAAGDVGNAAQQAGEAVDRAADEVTDGN